MNHLKYYIILPFLLACTYCFSQTDFMPMLIQTGKLNSAGKHAEMLALSQKGEKMVLAENPNDSLNLSHFRRQIGNAYYGLGENAKSIQAFNKAIAIAPMTEDGQSSKGKILYDRAFPEAALNQYTTAYQTVKKAEAILIQLKEPDYDYLLSTYANLGGKATALGFYEEAEFYLKKGMKLHEANAEKVIYLYENHVTKPVIFQHKFIDLYASQKGKEAQLLKHLADLENIKNSKEMTPRELRIYAVSLNLVSDFYMVFQEDFDKKEMLEQAEKYLNRGLDYLNASAYPSNYLQLKYNLAKLFWNKKSYEKALAIHEEILSLTPENDYRKPFFIGQGGLILMEKGEPKAALKKFEEMIKVMHVGKNPLQKNYANFVGNADFDATSLPLSAADYILKYAEKDTVLLRKASQFYQVALTQFKGSYQEKKFNQKLREFYNRAVGGILKMEARGFGWNNDADALLEDIENIENRLAWQEFFQNRQLAEVLLPDSLAYAKLDLRSKLVQARQEENADDIVDFEHQLENLNQIIRAKHPKIAAIEANDFSINSFQKKLSKGTAALRYKQFDDHWFVFLITQNSIEIQPLDTTQHIEKLVTEYVQILKSIQENKAIGKQLAQQLLPFDTSPFSDFIIIPDGVLFQFPFETLVSKNGTYLIQNQNISYANHLIFTEKKLIKSSNNFNTNQIMVFRPDYGDVAPPLAVRENNYRLEGAKKEAAALSKIFDAQNFENYEATKQNFFNAAPNAEILHLAMHAKINAEVPELSYLVFTETNGDNKIYLEELCGLNLRADLAVLSACNTGRGEIDEQKGLVSFHQAFTLAGVSSTVSSLWNAPDVATQEIMISFYQHLKNGETKPTALRKAKLDYLQNIGDKNLEKPFFWAGFVMHGGRASIDFSDSSDWNIWWILAGLLGISLLVIAIKK